MFEYVKESNFKRFECILSKIYSVYTLELLWHNLVSLAQSDKLGTICLTWHNLVNSAQSVKLGTIC